MLRDHKPAKMDISQLAVTSVRPVKKMNSNLLQSNVIDHFVMYCSRPPMIIQYIATAVTSFAMNTVYYVCACK